MDDESAEIELVRCPFIGLIGMKSIVAVP